ncbi:MAG TPA: 23S rRNA (uracil(1939)-C(5))-methyltransferase RlmD [Acidobacteriaceae bacterium]|nr:23S rRNA (uracil(1939)-C(5))-methyltransferase RlmD [Acidobacteriaceae bacterium]
MADAANVPEQDRATPPCPHFGPCGGCQLQHLTYPAQLALKAARLNQLLAATNLTIPELQLHASPPLAYRNRIRLTLAEHAGQLRAGYLTANAPQPALTDIAPASSSNQPTFLAITQCPIAAPMLWRTTEALLTILNNQPDFWLRNPRFKLDQLELFTTADESALQFTLHLRTAAKSLPTQITAAFTTLCETLRTELPQLTGASVALLPLASKDRSRRNELPRPGPTWGAPGLLYPVSQIAPSTAEPATNWVPRGAFFQINRFLIPKLLSLVTEGRSGQLAFDLYAGVGLFCRALAHSFTRVTAVEIAEPAASALASTKLRNLQAVKATTLDFLRTAVLDRDRPDLIVLDPPRTGAGPEVCALLARIAAPTLVYVSCSPETLPTDLTTLATSGYTVTELHLLDLFPQTNHIETIAILTRTASTIPNHAPV